MDVLEDTFVGAELRYQLRRWLGASGSVACCCRCIVPVSPMSFHCQCLFLVNSTGVVVSSLPIYRCFTVVCYWRVMCCLITISTTVLSMCHCWFIAHCFWYFVPVLLFLWQYSVAPVLLTLTLSRLYLVAVLFWYCCHLISVFYRLLQYRLSVLKSCRKYFCTKYTLTLHIYPLRKGE